VNSIRFEDTILPSPSSQLSVAVWSALTVNFQNRNAHDKEFRLTAPSFPEPCNEGRQARSGRASGNQRKDVAKRFMTRLQP
jgi:hypothetical protein